MGEDLPNDWDPMKEDSKALSNNYKYDPTDIGNVVQGFKSVAHSKICHQFLKGYCKFGVGCVYKHLTQEQVDELDSEEVLLDTLERDIVSVGTQLRVTVTSFRSPYSFYLVPAEDIVYQQSYDSRVGRNYDFVNPTLRNLMNLQREMLEFYRNPANGENMMVFPGIGSLVAVRGRHFYRARVLDMDPDNDEVTVMNIDSGVELTVHRREVFTLRPKFASLPAFGIHCTIEIPPGLNVTDQVAKNFKDLVLGRKFKAHFKERDITERFVVDLFHFNGLKLTI